MAGGSEIDTEDQAAMETPVQPQPSSREVMRAQQRRAAVNRFFGITLELGSAVFHFLNGAWLIGTDLKLSSAGCDAPDKPCGGPPFLLLVPAGATTMGWIGAVRLAEAREANLRDSTVYWRAQGRRAARHAWPGTPLSCRWPLLAPSCKSWARSPALPAPRSRQSPHILRA